MAETKRRDEQQAECQYAQGEIGHKQQTDKGYAVVTYLCHEAVLIDSHTTCRAQQFTFGEHQYDAHFLVELSDCLSFPTDGNELLQSILTCIVEEIGKAGIFTVDAQLLAQLAVFHQEHWFVRPSLRTLHPTI